MTCQVVSFEYIE